MARRQSLDQHGKGAPDLNRLGWVSLAEPAVLDLVNTQLAVPHLEIDARLWEGGATARSTGRALKFFPHILQEATNNLVARGHINQIKHETKGGRYADLYTPADTSRGQQTAIARATRRKGMLYGRYISYSATFGAAGEAVVRESLTDVMRHGYQSINNLDPFGEVRRGGNASLNGPLDSGAWLTVLDPDRLPLDQHAVLIEVKNRRQTLYPRHDEVHQLLHKTAIIQQAHPKLPIVPLLICRRAHDRLFWMAKDLGFLVHQARRQFLTLPPKTEVRLLDEVRNEMALLDLTLVTTESRPRISSLFKDLLPSAAVATALRWATVGSRLLPHYAILRKDILRPWDRNAALAALRTEAAVVLADADVESPILAWALEEEEPEPDYDV
jgi:hypothetical protein